MIRLMQVGGSHPAMMSWGVVLGVIVSKVGGTRFPVDMVLALLDSVLEPVESHVNGFGATLLDCVVEDAVGTGIVNLERGGWLGMSKLEEGLPDGNSVLGIDEGCPSFSFSGRGHNIGHSLGNNVDGSIVGWIRGVVTEEVIARGSATGFGCTKIGAVRVNSIDHITGNKSDYSIRIGCGIVE